MDLIDLMPKEDNDESNIEPLDSIRFNGIQYLVYGQKDDGISYQTMIIKDIIKNGDDVACDIVLNLNEYNGQIKQEDDLIVANFTFTIDDNCNFDFVGIERLRKRFQFD